ncbi:MAG: GAF domain-containing protein, partial [Deltaproteobacteria bacterium]|nr:GAF domain-containing protein [Deltaproteobacteria bacterium]
LYSIPPFLTLCCFAGLAALTAFRARRTRTNGLFFIICLLGSFLHIDILVAFNVKSVETALWVSRADHFFLVYIIPVYIHFFHSFLHISRRKWLVPAAYAYAFVLMCFTLTPLYIESMQRHDFGYFARGGVIYPLFGLGSLFATVYALVLIYRAIRFDKSNIRKNRLKYVFAGFGVMGLMNGLDVIPTYGHSVYPPGNLSFIPLIVFAFGVFKHDLLDMGILIKKSLVYSLLTALLTFMYAFVVIVADKMFKDSHFSESIYFPILFFFLITFLFGPLKTATQALIDRFFFKDKYDYQKTIKDVSQMIVSVLDQEEVTRRLLDTVVGAMRVGNGVIFLGNRNGSAFKMVTFRGEYGPTEYSGSMPQSAPLIEFMEKNGLTIMRKHLNDRISDPRAQGVLADMDALHAEIALPMLFKNTLNGFIVLGEKRSGDIYTKEDMDLLETLSSQGALAVENARSYKSIQDLNRGLEEKVKQRTLALSEALSEKERTQEQLIRSESLAAIGQLIAGVAHELNNPLASVTSLIQSFIEDIEYGDEQNLIDEESMDDLRFADKELARAKSIVASLLGLSRQTQTYSEPVCINAVVKDALRVLHNQYKDVNLDIIENYSQDIPAVHGNFANLGQVVLNIIQNAIQAVTGKKGMIFLDTRFENHTHQVVLECKDNGHGIPESIRQDIFKPFFTTKEVGKGTGLGLYICHEIIQRHGGELIVEDADAQGTRFVMRLPTIPDSS